MPDTGSSASGASAQALSPSPPSAVSDVPERPALAPDVQLLGEMQGSGFKDRQWLVLRGSTFIQLTELLYRVAEQINGERTLEEIAAGVTEATSWIVSADHVRRLIQTKLIPLRLVATAHDPGPPPGATAGEARARAPLAVNMRNKLLGPRIIDPITWVLQVLYLPPILIPMLLAIAAAQWWLFAVHGVTASLYAALRTPGPLLAALAILAASGLVHEFGHASALRYGGGRARAIGAGFYLMYPAFYTDTTDSYRLGRWARVRTDLGGVYFHLIFTLGMIGLYFLYRQDFLLLVVVLIDLSMVDQFLPYVRFDGYWVLVDLTGLPDFFGLIGPFVRSVWPSRGRKRSGPRLPPLKPWVQIVFTLYIVVTIPLLVVLLALLVAGLPHALPILWDAFLKQAAGLRHAESARNYVGVAASIVTMLLLEVQVLGLGVLLYMLGRGPLWGLLRALWNWGAPLRRRRAAAPAVGAAPAGAMGPGAVGAAAPMRLAVTPAAAGVVWRGRLSLTLALEAATDAEVRCHLDVGGVPASWYDLRQHHVTLRRGERVRVPLIVHPPDDATTSAGSYPITITATPESAPGCAVSTVATVTVDAVRGLSMDVMPAEVEGRVADFAVTFLNHMNWPAALRLVVSDDKHRLRFRTEPASAVVVPAGEAGGVIVRAVPKLRHRIGKARTFDVTFRGVLVGDEAADVPLLTRRARFTYVPHYAARPRRRRVAAWAWIVPLVLLSPLLASLAGPAPATVATKQPGVPTHVSRLPTPRPGAARAVASLAAFSGRPLLLDPLAITFGPQTIDTVSIAQTVHLVNVGAAPLSMTNIAITGRDARDFRESNTCARATIAVYNGCTISVTFTPLATGARSATLLISDNGPGSPQTVPLRGQG